MINLKQDGRLPLENFQFFNFVEDAHWKNENFFFQT